MSENIKTKQPEGRHGSIIFMARVSPEGYYLRWLFSQKTPS